MKNTATGRVLVMGDDMRIFLAVVRSLGRAGKEVHAAPFNWRAPALKSKYISVVHHLPRYSDDAAAWLEATRRIFDQHAFDLVIPCSDPDILPLDFHRAEFAGTRLAIPDHRSMDVLFDKQQTRGLARSLDIPVQPGAVLTEHDTMETLSARFGLPVVIKPRRSFWLDQLHTSGKVYIVDTAAELERVLGEIDDRSRYIAEGFFAGGSGAGVSVLAEDGRILHAFQHRRMREGRGGSSSLRVSEDVNPELLGAARAICGHTGLTGVCMFEFRHEPESGRWTLLETNARFWGSCALPISLGVDFPLYLYDLMVHGVRHEAVPYRTGVRSRNLVLDGYNLIKELRYLKRLGLVAHLIQMLDFAAQPIGWLTGRERSDSFAPDDLRPGFGELGTLFGAVRRKLPGGTPAHDRRRSDRAPGAEPGPSAGHRNRTTATTAAK